MKFANNPLFLNTVLLGGTSEEKISAAAGAGFQQIELWRQDVEKAQSDVRQLTQFIHAQGLALTDYQVLLDFTGAPDVKRAEKRSEALTLLDTAAALDASTLLVPASTDPACIAQREEEDLLWLTQEAKARGLRVAFEAMAWSTHINTLPQAWRLVENINEAGLGLVVDAFHLFTRRRTVADLANIPAEKIFLVQLSDLAVTPEIDALSETARHRRLLPGEGNFPLSTLLGCLSEKGYSGPLGLEVFNDELHQQPPSDIAKKAMRALKNCLAQ